MRLTTGKLSQDAMDRAAVVADFYFGNSISLMGLIHDDRDELRRSKAVRFIASHPGCRDRELCRLLHCSVWQLEKDIAPTIVARGDAHTVKGQWFPGAGKGDKFAK